MSKNFINLTDNDEFVRLRGLDLQELIVQVENYLLEYRKSLGLPQNLTIGVEIEYEGVIKKLVDRFIDKKLPEWESKSDGSLSSGGEINSPIMRDKSKYWEELKLVCDYLTKNGADTQHNAGGHIHIGTNILGEDIEAWKQFLKLYILYENVLFRFIYGDKVNGRKGLMKYAPPIADQLYRDLDEINEAKDLSQLGNVLVTGNRYAALNFSNVHFFDTYVSYKNTFEFRCPNATTNAIVSQNNINACAKMLVTSKQKVMDEDFLDYKLKNEFTPYRYNTYFYDTVNLKNALEFVDLVFDNNLDKVYFLRQYLKSFQELPGIKTTVKAKTFVKSK